MKCWLRFFCISDFMLFCSLCWVICISYKCANNSCYHGRKILCNLFAIQIESGTMYRKSSNFHMLGCMASCIWVDRTYSCNDRVPKWFWDWRFCLCYQSRFILAKTILHHYNNSIFLHTFDNFGWLVPQYSTTFGTNRRAG